MKPIRALVHSMLKHECDVASYGTDEPPPLRDWSLQGLGMLRTYFDEDKVYRLHVWDDRYSGGSPIHTHPWDFESLVLAGTVHQKRFFDVDKTAWGKKYTGTPFARASLICGPGGGLLPGEPEKVRLGGLDEETYTPGMTYWQHAEEIHWSYPDRGTVTLVERKFRENTDEALVFWPWGEEWASAEPRKATVFEVHDILSYTLEHWDD